MKTIGILGGMSWQSTMTYYQQLNEGVADELGGLHSAKLLLSSVDFAPIAKLQQENQWQTMAQLLTDEALKLEQAGAQAIVIATNTMHLVAPQIQAATSVPLLHIADAVGQRIQSEGKRKVALLGTAFTMEMPFYSEFLQNHYGIEVIIPDANQRADVHRIIYEELCQGQCLAESKAIYQSVITSLQMRGAEGVILGCTEIGLLIKPEDVSLALYDSALLHCQHIVQFALKND